MDQEEVKISRKLAEISSMIYQGKPCHIRFTSKNSLRQVFLVADEFKPKQFSLMILNFSMSFCNMVQNGIIFNGAIWHAVILNVAILKISWKLFSTTSQRIKANKRSAPMAAYIVSDFQKHFLKKSFKEVRGLSAKGRI